MIQVIFGTNILRLSFDGCYSYKFLRSSARRFLLEILARVKRYEQRSSSRLASPLTIVKTIKVFSGVGLKSY